MAETLPAPIALAMIICDAIWVDPSTGKITILGVFNEIGAKSFPVRYPTFTAHICMTDGQGRIPIKLQLVDVDEEEPPLFEVENDVDFPDRRTMIYVNIHLDAITFPTPGEYYLRLFGRGVFMMERRVVIRQT